MWSVNSAARPFLLFLTRLIVTHSSRLVGLAGVKIKPAETERSSMERKLKRLEIARSMLWFATMTFVILAPTASGFRVGERASARPRAEEAPPPAPPEKSSVAVLPFTNRSTDRKETRFFSEGIHDDLLTALVKIPDLRVISRTSVMGYRNSSKNIREIAEELGVATVLEGGVQRAGNRVRINAQLVDAQNDRHLWAATFDRELTVENIFNIQSEIVQQIARALEAQFAPEGSERIVRQPTDNLEAYDYYLRGLEYFKRVGEEIEDHLNAQRLYERAVEADPEFALAHARLSEIHSFLYVHHDHSDERLKKMRVSAERSLSLDPDLPEGRSALAWYYLASKNDGERALEELTKAQRVSPRNSELLEDQAWILGIQGRWKESLSIFERAITLDPRNPALLWSFGEVNMGLGRFETAEANAQRALELAPDSYIAGLLSARIPLYRSGDTGPLRTFLEGRPFKEADIAFLLWQLELWDRNFDDALETLTRTDREFWAFDTGFYPKPLLQGFVHYCAGDAEDAANAFASARQFLEPRLAKRSKDPWLHSALGLVFAGLDRKEEAIREARRAVELMPSSKRGILGPWYIFELAMVYTILGDHENAVAQFELYFSQPLSFTIEFLLLDPRIDPLREDPEFKTLVESLRSDGRGDE